MLNAIYTSVMFIKQTSLNVTIEIRDYIFTCKL